MFRMVASDVDGTLIYKGSHLNTARLPVMLAKLKAQGVPFVVATGRHYRELKKLFGKSCDDIVCCCCDGAYVISQEREICSLPLPKKCVIEFFDRFAGDPKNAVEFHGISTSFLLGGTPLLLSKENTRLGNVKRIFSHDELTDEIVSVSLYGPAASSFSSSSGARLSYSSRDIAEFANRNTSKFSAVSFIAEEFGVSINQTLYFGDGENDRELIQKCGTSYTTYCADKNVFPLTKNHTRDCIGTIIRLCDERAKNAR